MQPRARCGTNSRGTRAAWRAFGSTPKGERRWKRVEPRPETWRPMSAVTMAYVPHFLLTPSPLPSLSSRPFKLQRFRDLLLSGSRDRSAKLFDLQSLTPTAAAAQEEKLGHKGHILGSAAAGDLILTSSSDGSVKVRVDSGFEDLVPVLTVLRLDPSAPTLPPPLPLPLGRPRAGTHPRGSCWGSIATTASMS